jgi:predicted acylesterase/phospholipase RssA
MRIFGIFSYGHQPIFPTQTSGVKIHKSDKSIALELAGGGARRAYDAGVIKYIF